MQEFANFSCNAVCYFVSYYDYQPEAIFFDRYLYRKDASINEEIDKFRHAATQLRRARMFDCGFGFCIYGLGSVEDYGSLMINVKVGDVIVRDKFEAVD